MGQKANPNGMRLGVIKDWNSRYFASTNKEWSEWVVQDKMIRNYFEKNIKSWSISRVEIDRTSTTLKISIFTSKPGTILGQEGKNIKIVEKEILKIIKNKNVKLKIDIREVEKVDLDARIIANEIANALENRIPFRIAQKKVIRRVMRSGAKGIKTQVSGRLNGVDMARSEGYLEGQVPLQTLRNNIDYARAIAKTTYGIIGVKVWISKGEILDKNKEKEINEQKKIVDRKNNEKLKSSNIKEKKEKKENNKGE